MMLDIDEDGWTARRGDGFAFVQDGDKYRFIVPGRSDVCEANVKGNQIALNETRSAAHKALLNFLGLNV